MGALSPLVICLGTFNYRDNCAFFYIQNQKSGQMKSKKLFPSVRFIIEPVFLVYPTIDVIIILNLYL